MLDLMRRHARNWLMKIILGIIIIVFVFYFGSMGGRERAERIAMIDGKPIVEADFQREYQNAVEMYSQRFGRGLTEEMLKALNLKQQVLDQLLHQAVILAKAEELGIRASDEELKAAILAYPGFQRNGAFDQRTYELALRQIKMTPDEFEESQRKMMVALRIEELVQDSVRISDQEVFDIYRMQTEKIACDFLQVPPARFQGSVKVTQADLEAFLKTREGQFRVPEQVQLKVLAFLGEDFAARGKVSDGEVADYYDRHKARFVKDGKPLALEAVRPTILKELGQAGGMYAAQEEAKKAHDTIYQSEDFDGYARQKGLPVRTTAFFPLSSPPQELRGIADLAKEIATLQKNETSRVLQGERGYYLVTLAERKAPYVPALKEIETELSRLYRETEANRLAKAEAEALLGRLKKGEALEAVAREKGLAVGATGFFQPGASIPKLGESPELTSALFELSAKKPYPERPVLIDGAYVIVRFKERGAVDEKAFAGQKEAIAKALEQQKKAMAIRDWIEGSKAALIKEGRLEVLRDVKDL